MTIEAARDYKVKLAGQAGINLDELDLSDEACQKLVDYFNEPAISFYTKGL